MFFRKKEKKCELSEYKNKDHVFRFIDKITGYRVVSTTVINKHSGKNTAPEIAYEIFNIYCKVSGLEASYREVDGELWFESVLPQRPNVSLSRINTATGYTQGSYYIETSILEALFAVFKGIKRPLFQRGIDLKYDYIMDIILSLWAVGYELDSILFKSSEHNYILEDAQKIIDSLSN